MMAPFRYFLYIILYIYRAFPGLFMIAYILMIVKDGSYHWYVQNGYQDSGVKFIDALPLESESEG